MRRVMFLVGRRIGRVRARLRARQERARLARTSVEGSADAPWAADPAALGGTLFVLAHQDDDLLFASTRLAGELAAGRPVTSVYLTAGDDGDDDWYWRAREAGVRAAYAHLAGVPDHWTTSTVPLAGQTVTRATLDGRPGVTIVFVRLPDGGVEGDGAERHGGASLRKLWEGRIATLTTVDGEATHSLAGLHALLADVSKRVEPRAIVTLDHSGVFGDGDHSDHHVVAFLAKRLRIEHLPEARFTGYVGYPVAERPANLSGDQIAVKEAAFFLYAQSDYKTCASTAACTVRPEGAWLQREYVAE